MLSRFLLFCLFALPTVVIADAGNGQFMGYELGASYPTTPPGVDIMTTGNLLIVAQDPVKPADIVQVSLVTTPASQTIGYIAAASWHTTEGEAREAGRRYVDLLRTRYPDWNFGREAMDASMRIVEVNFDKPPYNLQLRLVRDQHEGRNMWRFSMGLGWQIESIEWRAWQDQAATEQAAVRTTERKKLINSADMRGL